MKKIDFLKSERNEIVSMFSSSTPKVDRWKKLHDDTYVFNRKSEGHLSDCLVYVDDRGYIRYFPLTKSNQKVSAF